MNQIEQTIRDNFAKQSLMRTFAAQVDHVEHGQVTISAPIMDLALQQHGVAHAGLTFALGDTAAGYTALSAMPEGSEVMTTEMKINLLAAGKGQRLRATGRIVKSGRRLIVVTAEVHAIDDDEETLIAVLQGTMIPLSS